MKKIVIIVVMLFLVGCSDPFAPKPQDYAEADAIRARSQIEVTNAIALRNSTQVQDDFDWLWYLNCGQTVALISILFVMFVLYKENRKKEVQIQQLLLALPKQERWYPVKNNQIEVWEER